MNSLILWGLTFFVPVVLCVLNINETRFKKNLAVGVTFPKAAREDPDVLRLLKGFRREQIILCLGMMALGAACAALTWPSLSFLPYFLWIDLLIAAQFASYARWNGKLKALKKARGWTVPAVRAASVTAAVPAKRVSGAWFVPAAVIAAAPAVFDRELWAMYLLDGAIALGCWAGNKYLYRNRAETVDENDAVTQALTRVRRRAWDRVWVLCAWMMAVISVGVWLSMTLVPGGQALLVAVVLLSLGVCAAAVGLEFQVRRVQEKLTAGSGEGFYVDEDDKWLWGQFYYDPNDSRAIVNNRTGANSTVNLARPAGKVIMALMLAVLLALPVMGLCFDAMGDAPRTLAVEDGVLTAESWGKDYVLPLEDIDSAELIDELPEITARVMGIGTDSLLKGKFRTEWGSATLCLDPREGPWLKVTMRDGALYLLGGGDSGAEAAWGELTK